MTFCEAFHKNVTRIECATHYERLYNACIYLKTIKFQRTSSKCQRPSRVISISSLYRFSLKEIILRISQNSLEIPCTWVSSYSSYSPPFRKYIYKRDSRTDIFLSILRNSQEYLRAPAWFFIFSRQVFRYAFLCVGFFNKSLLMKIFGDIFVMPLAKE